jgi:transposase
MNKFSNIDNNRPCIGIDTGKAQLDIYADTSQKLFTCDNRPKDLRRLAKQLEGMNPQLIVLEASGGYERAAVTAFSELSLPVAVVYPKRVRQFARGLGIIAKTDKIDAQVIAYYARVAAPAPTPPKTSELSALEALTSRRAQLIEMRLTEQNRIELAHPSIQKEIKQHVAWIERQISKTEDEIERQIRESDTWRQTDELLRSVPGVGAVLSSTLITDMPELGSLTSKEVAALAGVAPFPRESGRWKGKRICQGGRYQLRRVLYMATIAATRFNPVIKNLYDRLCQCGKPKKLAIIACARKLLVILNAMTKNNSPWSPKLLSLP